MSEWTPGPWVVVDGYDYYVGYARPGNPSRLDNVMSTPESLANVRLCAAAPDLYEALEAMVRRLTASQQNWEQAVIDAQRKGDHELSVSLRNTALQALNHFPTTEALAALAKARGEAQ